MDDYVVTMMGGVGMQVISAVYLASLVGIAVFRPGCIRKKPLFRIAGIVYAASFVAPFVIVPLVFGLSRGMDRGGHLSSLLLPALCPFLLGVSIILLFSSIVCGSDGNS